MTTSRFLLEEKFRSNRRFELLEWNRLSQPERDALAGLSKDGEVFGLFVPVDQDPRLTYKVAYKEVALLYFVLLGQQNLPAYTRLVEKNEMNENIARLVLEGLLEIEWKGEFVSGAAAWQAIYDIVGSTERGRGEAGDSRSGEYREDGGNRWDECPETGGYRSGECQETGGVEPDKGPSFIAGLSLQALEYVIRLEGTDTRAIASRLYGYNSLPVFPAKMTAFQTVAGIENFLGVSGDGPYEWQLNRHWEKNASSPDSKWLSWSRRGDRKSRSGTDLTYKLYISPVWKSLPKALVLSLKILSSSAAFSFKIGNDPHGILRPDKMVVYFQGYEELEKTARALEDALAGIGSQGVPFTAQIDGKGLLSWGVDPPGSDVLENFEGGSWRARVTDKLAAAIVQAKTAGMQRSEIVHYALHRVGLEGMDTESWTPGKQIWQ